MKNNDVNFLQSTDNVKLIPNPRIGMIFAVIIIVHSYLIPFISLISGGDINKYTNYVYLSTLISYTIIVLSIIVFHGNGLEVFQDHFSLWIIVLTCFFRASLGGTNEIIYKYILILLGVVLSVFIVANRKRIKVPNLKSVLIGLIWSVSAVTAAALFSVVLLSNHGTLPSNLLSYIITQFEVQLSFVTVIEEAYFRGLLFGFLVMNGFSENKALLIQALLFWGTHFMDSADLRLFFVVIPLLILIETLIIKKYKMLYLTIMLHTLNNVFGGILVAIL
jgi:membrane protease YdiL (CAAX protease family)